MERKTTRGGILADVKQRTFEGYGAAYTLDLGGDRIIPGAFAWSLFDFVAGKAYVPLADSHSYSSIRSILGVMVDAEERKQGLWTKFEVVDSPDGDELLARIKMGAVTGLSIGYEVRGSEYVQEDGKRVRLLTDLRLREISAVVYPMNPDAQIIPDTVKRSTLAPGGARMPHDWSMPKGYAPNHPRRLAMEDLERALQIRELARYATSN